MATEQRIYIHGRAIANSLKRYHLQLAQNCSRFRRQFRLDRADNHILAAFAAAARFIQHAGRFSHSGSIAKKYFEVTLIEALEDRIFVENVIASKPLQGERNNV